MGTEIEAKLKVDSFEQIEKALVDIGAEFISECSQSDLYFDDDNSSMVAGDKCLRIRSQTCDNNKKYFLTFKGPKQKSDIKKRVEIEFEIPDADLAEQLLAALNYKKDIIVEKIRRLYRYDDCLIALDHLPALGNFVEIEGPVDSNIQNVRKLLGLSDVKHIPQSYAELIDSC